MRKLLPLVQEMQQFLNAATTDPTTSSIFSAVTNKNVYFDVYKDNAETSQKVFMTKRPGLFAQTDVLPSSGLTAGMICADAKTDPAAGTTWFSVWSDGTNANTKFYLTNTNVAKPGGWTGNNVGHDIIPLSNNSGLYGGYYWALTNYKEGAVVTNTGVSTQITSANYIAWTDKSNMIAFDGYIFQADTTSGYIYNSDLNSPSDLGCHQPYPSRTLSRLDHSTG
jgi:hypothetical protein